MRSDRGVLSAHLLFVLPAQRAEFLKDAAPMSLQVRVQRSQPQANSA